MCQPGNPVPQGAAQVSSRPAWRGFPQRPVRVEPLVRVDALLATLGASPVPGAQVREPVPGQLAVAGEGAGREVHRAGRGLVRVAGLQQLADQLDHQLDGLAGPGRDVGRADVQRGTVPAELRLVVPGDIQRTAALGPRLGDDLVLAVRVGLVVVGQVPHVGDVLAADDRQLAAFRGPPDQVGQQIGAQVADVRGAVHGRPAGVDAQAVPAGWPDWLDLPGPGVIEPQHAPSLWAAAGQGPQRGVRAAAWSPPSIWSATVPPGYGRAARRSMAASMRSSVAVSAIRTCWPPAGP